MIPDLLPRALRAVRAWAVLACIAFPCVTVPAAAQNPSSAVLRGRVTDDEGAPLAAAQVTVVHGPTGFQARAASDAEGVYQLTGMRPGGPYSVRVTRLGFAPAERRDVALNLGQVLVVDFRMNPATTVLEEITVQAAVDTRFNSARTGAATIVSQEAIELHPLVERDFLQMADVSPLVTRTESGGISVSGQNERYNSITINGALHQDVFGAFASGVPGAEARAKAIPLSAIQEFQVQVAPYDVRSSGFTGGYLNAVSKSGTNEWRGSVFGELRDKRMAGGLVVDGTDFSLEDYRKQVFGGSMGGPLARDRIHLFLAGEVETRHEPPSGYSLGLGDPMRTRVSPDSAIQVEALLPEYGAKAGTLDAYRLSNPAVNLFGRLDWRLNDVHSLTMHVNHASARRDVGANRAAHGAYEFSSAGYRAESSTQSAMVQLGSRLGERLYNELRVSVQRTEDRHTPASEYAQVDVEVLSVLDGTLLQRTLRAGSIYTYQNSDLRQTVLQVSDAFSIPRGDITTTLGLGVDFFAFDQRYQPGSRGAWRFSSLQDLRDNTPSHYEINLLQPGQSESVQMKVLQPAVYAQNEHNFPGGLRLYYGMRIDMPLFPTGPDSDPRVSQALGLRTDRLPTGKLLWSPRLGFNWQSTHPRYITQFRGGFGMFTGRLPYVWLSNAYAYTGARSRLLACDGFNTPLMDLDAPAPTTCLDGEGAAEAGHAVLVGFDPGFRYPREYKVSAALDQRLPWGFTASAEALVVQTMAQVTVEDVGLYGYEDDPTFPRYEHVLVFGNEETSGFAHAVTLGLEKEFGSRLTVGGSYTFNHSDDVQSMQSGDALINAGTNPGRGSRAPSAFERPWKTLGYARGSLPQRWGGTQLSLMYVAQAGNVYSYVYADDLNGDGYPGVGIQLDAGNDLLFVPQRASDLSASIPTIAFMGELMELDPCLRPVRRAFVKRNSCRAPASHRVDLKLVQPLSLRARRVELSATVVNALNLLNADWGRVVEVAQRVPVLALAAEGEVVLPPNPSSKDPYSNRPLSYVGPLERDPVTGKLRAALPGIVVASESQWQAQVGLQLFF
ncbi:TonB-dependent receptor [Longimicrobium sp.]|uniref:TonB-dependent receptor n=1 Tax=Longimicrobium sp. TaxID=2029185 RepID=UPI003B3ACEAB